MWNFLKSKDEAFMDGGYIYKLSAMGESTTVENGNGFIGKFPSTLTFTNDARNDSPQTVTLANAQRFFPNTDDHAAIYLEGRFFITSLYYNIIL